jgi:hypothetical protein
VILLLATAALVSGVACSAVVLVVGRMRAGRIVDAPHVRLVLVHEGADDGDFTVDGFQLRQYRDRSGESWLVLRDVTVLRQDKPSEYAEGEMHVPVRRIVVRQSITDVRVGPIEVRA